MEEKNIRPVKNRKKLRTSLLCATIVFAVLLSAMIGTIGYLTYRKGMIEKYQQYISGIINLTLSELDSDTLEKSVRNGVPDPALKETQGYLDQIKDSHEIEYIYIIKPLNHDTVDNMMYLMTGISKEEQDDTDNVKFGDLSGEEYSGEVVSHYFDYMERDNGVEFYANKTAFGYMYTGSRAIHASDGTSVAVLSVDISMDEIYGTLHSFVAVIFISAVLLTGLFLLLLYKWQNRRILIPVSSLEKSTVGFAESSRNAETPEALHFENPDIHTHDEIEELSDAVCDMASGIKKYMMDYISVSKEKERIGAELSVATQIQADMLPSIFPAYPERKEFDLFASMDPAKEVGGDFYDFFMTDEDHLGIVIGDVSGKGVPAALFMVISKTLIKNYAMMGLPADEVFTRANNDLCEGNKAGLFTTAWIGIYELSTGTIRFTDAGHETPLRLRPDGTVEYMKPVKKKMVLAAMEDTQYIISEAHLEPEDMLFIYTDGVPEATDAQNELYGMERLEKILAAHRGGNPAGLLREVRADVDTFVGKAPQFDDLTMLALEIHGYAERKEGKETE